MVHWRQHKPLIMATHCSIREFNPVQEDWVSYTEHLIQYFMANGISAEGEDEESHPPQFMCNRLICNLCSCTKIYRRKKFFQHYVLIKVHHQPHPSMIVQRFFFHTGIQKPSESVSEYVTLRNIVNLEIPYRTCCERDLCADAKINVNSVNY